MPLGSSVVWVRVVQTLTESSNGPKAIGQPGALVWDGRVFTTSAQLKAYLTSRGLSYSRWAARHPTAFGADAGCDHAHDTTKTAKPAAASRRVAVGEPDEHTVAVRRCCCWSCSWSAGSSSAVARYCPRAMHRTSSSGSTTSQDRRMVALAAATAILLGFGVAFYLMG